MIKFGWVITNVNDEFLDVEEVGTMGPSNMTASKEEIVADGREFRMYDDDGILYYEGRYLGPDDERMFAPLDNFGRPNAGCVDIYYKNKDGKWECL